MTVPTDPTDDVARKGRVEAFDERAGLGTVADVDGVTYEFHCVEIADGRRTIAVGAAVVFGARAKLGRAEAVGIVQLDEP